jgi:hypothetical protein
MTSLERVGQGFDVQDRDDVQTWLEFRWASVAC